MAEPQSVAATTASKANTTAQQKQQPGGDAQSAAATLIAATAAAPAASASASASVSAPASGPAPATSASTSASTFQFPQYYHFPPMFTLQPNLDTRRAQMDKWSALVLAYCRHYRIFRLALGLGHGEPRRDGPGGHGSNNGSGGGSGGGGGGGSSSNTEAGPIRVDAIRGGAGSDESQGRASDSRPAAAAAADTGNADVNDHFRGRIAYLAPDLFRNRHIDRALAPAAVRQVIEALRRDGRAEWAERADSADARADGSASAGDDVVYVYWRTPEEWAAVVEAYVDETGQRGSVLTLYELAAGDATRGTELHGIDPAVLQRALAVLVRRGKAQVFGAEESLGVKFF